MTGDDGILPDGDPTNPMEKNANGQISREDDGGANNSTIEEVPL